MSAHDSLVKEIERFLRATGMEETIFGHRVQREWRLVERLRSGGDVTTRTAEKIRDYMANYDKLDGQATKSRRTSLSA